MAMKTSMAVLAAALLTLPAAGAWAQASSSTTTNGMPMNSQSGSAAENPHVKGATGETIVKGDRSTISADKSATSEQKTGNSSK